MSANSNTCENELNALALRLEGVPTDITTALLESIGRAASASRQAREDLAKALRLAQPELKRLKLWGFTVAAISSITEYSERTIHRWVSAEPVATEMEPNRSRSGPVIFTVRLMRSFCT